MSDGHGFPSAVARADPRAAQNPVPVRDRMPSGTVSFLFTDIEGSTQRWDRDREAMQAAVRRHDAIVRGEIERHGGYVFKTIGDAFCAAFSSAAGALTACLGAQAALGAEDFSAVGGLRVRMAVHTGTADERDGDYFGPTVNRVARLLSIGHGGQILLSRVTVELAEAQALFTGIRDMGVHRLKDLSEPEHVFTLDVPGGPLEFPKLRSLGVGLSNLPEEVKSFIGRESDIAEIGQLLGHARLVTLVGVGGVGKTSCSLKIGAGLITAYADGVWFVDLAALSDAALVAAEVAAVFGVVESAKRPIIEALTTHLRDKKTLILLDNCEHVIDACSRLAAGLLRACPGVSLLATSREALKVSGERVYHLPTLAVPDSIVGLRVDEVASYGAVALFVARARAVDSRFDLNELNVASVAQICRRLDGIPLAIELAAARVRVLAPRQLERKLDERFRLLTGGSRNVLPRQQTMRALIDWSYDLLDAREQGLLSTLSIFSGSFSLESAIAVSTGADLEDYEFLDGLTSLVDKSLVVAEPFDAETRYRLLESLRHYGHERLNERGTYPQTARRHAIAYTELAERLEDAYGSTPYRVWLANAEREAENVRAALAWAFGAQGEVEIGLRLAATLRRMFSYSHPAEARRWVQTALGRAGSDSPARIVARLELADAHLASRLNQFNAALAAARRALTGFQASGDRRGVANAQRWAGRSLIFLGQIDEGENLLRSALDTYAILGFRQIGGVLLDLGSARTARKDIAGAREFFRSALEVFEEHQDDGNAAIAAGTLAEAEFAGGDPQTAVRHAQAALTAASQLNRHYTVWLQSNLAAFLIALDRFEDARLCIHEALHSARQLGSELYVTVLLQHLAATLALESGSAPGAAANDYERAARLAGYVDRKLGEIDFTREFTEQQEYDRMMSALTRALGAELLATLMTDGAAQPDARSLDLALDDIQRVLALPAAPGHSS